MKKTDLIILFFVCVAFIYCVPENKKLITEVNIDLNNPELQRLINYIDKQETDSISAFFEHEDPSFRNIAANGFASNQDPLAINDLSMLLNDPIIDVRKSAAYALGQIAKSKVQDTLLKAFNQQDTISVDNSFNSTVLEAMGKIGEPKYLKAISTVSTYRNTDTLLLLGQTRAIYRYMMRDIILPEGTSAMMEIINNDQLPQKVRLMAAHYFSRAKDLDIDPFKFQLGKAFNEEDDPNIKMALAIALGKSPDPEIQNMLIDQLNLKQDYRILVNCIRSLNKSSYIKVAEPMINLLSNENKHIAMIAADFFLRNGNKEDVSIYRKLANDSIDFRVNALLYKACFANTPHYYSKTRNSTRWMIQQRLKDEKDPLVIINYLDALAEDPESYDWIHDNLMPMEDARIKAACVAAYGRMLLNKDFNIYFRSSPRLARKKMLAYIQEAMEEGDEGVLGAAGDIFSNPASGLKVYLDSINFLVDAKEKLSMPGQAESIHALERAIGFMNEQPNVDLSPVRYNHPIDWNLMTEVGENTKALVKTNKGVFTIRFYTKEAPGSVLNFIQLAKDNFYDEKIFHRVVPNFVIQTGSPRNDLYGGEDYTIRSELSQLYYDEEGYVGMASAGLHTESTQWFVTHSPTPHLDGNYTIFGKVIEGMDVVHQIQQGDQILDIVISKL